jgi:glycosyltransferase involved in cell wall biosynthesis
LRILFFTPYQLWPSNSGARLRSLHLASALGRTASVTLLQILQPNEVVFTPNDTALSGITSARKEESYTPKKILAGILGPVPLTVLNYQSTDISGVLRTTLSDGRFDSVQLESIHLFPYIDAIRTLARRPEIVLDWHNIESELMLRYAVETKNLPKQWIARRTAGLLTRLENVALRTCSAHTVVSDRERDKLLARHPGASVHVVPNGVDTSAFAVRQIAPALKSLLFVGSMDYHANIDAVTWFAATAWPMLSSRLPDLKFVIVGRSPAREVQAIAGGQVHVTGTVDDVRPFYTDALAMIVPLRVGGGTRLKILEAMAMGVPVISTTVGAEGIDARHEENILIADNENEMVAAVERLAFSMSLQTRLAATARKMVETRYDWGTIGSHLFALHRGLNGTCSLG